MQNLLKNLVLFTSEIRRNLFLIYVTVLDFMNKKLLLLLNSLIPLFSFSTFKVLVFSSTANMFDLPKLSKSSLLDFKLYSVRSKVSLKFSLHYIGGKGYLLVFNYWSHSL